MGRDGRGAIQLQIAETSNDKKGSPMEDQVDLKAILSVRPGGGDRSGKKDAVSREQ